MSLLDERGRVFGRINLFDAAVGVAIVLVLPFAYGTALLFRAPTPRISSVARVEITKEERRLAGGSLLTAKLKVVGSGFRPLLHAVIDDQPALGFVFENPNSADVLVGQVPAGSHDLVLFDGVQEVARAPRAITVQAVASPHVRAVGALIGLDKAMAEALQPGARFPPGADPQSVIVQLGPLRPDSRRVTAGPSVVDVPVPGRWQRPAAIVLQCDPDPNNEGCAVSGRPLAGEHAPTVTIAGPGTSLTFVIDELLPEASPRVAHARVRLAADADLLSLVKRGDRDLLLDDRAASIVEIGGRRTENGVASVEVTLRFGADEASDGWRYRGRPLMPGETFRLVTDRYTAGGSILSVAVDAPLDPSDREAR